MTPMYTLGPGDLQPGDKIYIPEAWGLSIHLIIQSVDDLQHIWFHTNTATSSLQHWTFETYNSLRMVYHKAYVVQQEYKYDPKQQGDTDEDI